MPDILAGVPRTESFILREAHPDFGRSVISVASGQGKLSPGTVLGAIYSTVGAAAAGNTGNATIAVSATIGALVKPGTYKVVCTAAPTTWIVCSPGGYSLGQATSGTAFTSDHIGFTITAGGTASVVGDSFTIVVSSSSVRALNVSGTNGSQTPIGVLAEAVDATSAAATGYMVSGLTYVKANELIWPSGITTDQKNAAIASLALKGVYVV